MLGKINTNQIIKVWERIKLEFWKDEQNKVKKWD